jgi:ammonia channel protein AmtB
MFFALSSSTICTLAFSYLMNIKPRTTDLFNGSISGAIIFGSVAGYATNIAVPITVGIFSAFISAFYKSKIMPSLNKHHAHDMLGLFGSFLIVAIIGAIAVAPIILKSFLNYTIVTSPMNSVSIVQANLPEWALIYVGISAGIGLITGMIISTIIRCCSGSEKRFGDNNLFIQNLNVEEKDLDYTS